MTWTWSSCSADRVLVFSDGKVIADDPPDQLFLDPAIRRHVLGGE